MGFKKWGACTCMFLLTCFSIAKIGTNDGAAYTVNRGALQEPFQAEFVTAEELKTKLAKNEPITIIDVRGSTSLSNGDNKIKGAIYVKLRRLKYRLGFVPLKDVPRNREVVTYCACPNDESSLKAARILRDSGFKNVRVLKGGWVVWKKINGQVEPLARGI